MSQMREKSKHKLLVKSKDSGMRLELGETDTLWKICLGRCNQHGDPDGMEEQRCVMESKNIVLRFFSGHSDQSQIEQKSSCVDSVTPGPVLSHTWLGQYTNERMPSLETSVFCHFLTGGSKACCSH